jgi:hypothetical protein
MFPISLLTGMPKSLRLFALAIYALTIPLAAQTPEPAGENLLRVEGTNTASGIHYLRLILLLKSPENQNPETEPQFAMECWERHGKRSLHWTVRFEGSSSFDFIPPVEPSPEDPRPTPNPTAVLKMRFEGYITSKDFKREWEVLPDGEYRYKNSGLQSSNLDDPRYFLAWLTSLPNLRIGFAKLSAGQPKELLFPLKPLLEIVKKSDLCQP